MKCPSVKKRGSVSMQCNCAHEYIISVLQNNQKVNQATRGGVKVPNIRPDQLNIKQITESEQRSDIKIQVTTINQEQSR